MTKAEIVNQIAKDADISLRAANAAVDSMVGSITKSLKKGNRVALPGLGSFDTAKRKARMGRNPQTGATIKISARRVARFRPAASLKETVR